MNVVVILNDSLRRDHVAAYGLPAPWSRPAHEGEPFIRTPNLDRLVAESACFDRFYCASYPTIPCRYDLFSGRYGFLERGWQPLEREDVILSELVAQHGYLPMLIFDTPALADDEYNYTRGFGGWRWIRGQHADRYVTDPLPIVLPAAPYKLKSVPATELYLRNTAHRQSEADWMCAKTIAAGMEWLERNYRRDGFVLWMDMWDPHEPFDAPDYDLARYADPTFAGESVIYPRYGRGDYLTPAERNHVRASYAALITLADRWLGRFLEKLETLGLDRNTLVLYLSDHGHLFGDHGLQGKPTGVLGKLYEVTNRVPLLIRHPDGVGAGKRIAGLAQHPDILPTILEFLHILIPRSVQGASLWPLVTGERASIHDYAISGRYSATAGRSGRADPLRARVFDGLVGTAIQAEPVTVTDEEWSLLSTPFGGSELYHLPTDPGQTNNLLASRPDVVSRMRAALSLALDDLAAPPDQRKRYETIANGPDEPARAVSDALALSPEDHVYVVHCGDGRLIAFRNEAEASDCNSSEGDGSPVQAMSLRALFDRDRQALVYWQDQYYWVADILAAS